MKYFYILFVFMFGLLHAFEPVIVESPRVVLNDTNLKSIRLDALHIKTNIVANVAHTTYEMIFYNPNNRVLEGSLHFPLFESQHVVGHALVINGKYRDAVVVEKTKAKKVFEAVIRKKIDPSLLEKTIGNNFKLRLYPIPANGYKKVKIVVEELLSSKKGAFRYAIAFNEEKEIRDFSVNIFSKNNAKVIFLEDEVRFDKVEQGYMFRFSKKNFMFKEPLETLIPIKGMKASYSQKQGKKSYFMKIISQKSARQETNIPKREKIEIIWDTSLGAFESDTKKKFSFLQKLFSRKTNFTVSLKTLGLRLTHQGTFRVENGEWGALRKRLNALEYNGANDLRKLRVNKNVDKALFFTNGIYTFSDILPKLSAVPLITVNASTKANPTLLKYMAKHTSGTYLDLLRLSSKEAVKKMYVSNKIRVLSKSKNIKSLFIEKRGDCFVMLGEIRGKYGDVKFVYQDKLYKIKVKQGVKNPYIARLHASYKIENLLVQKKRNKKKIIRLAKRYGLVTDFTSMLVLESLDDYIRYEVVPPKVMKREYFRIVDGKKRAKKEEEKQTIEEVVRLIENQKKWYKKKFPKTKRPELKRVKKRKRMRDYEEGGDIVSMEELASPAPPMLSSQKVSKDKSEISAKTAKISLKEWNSKAPYMTKIRNVPKNNRIQTYYKLQVDYIKSASFYVDMSEYFYKKGYKYFALEVLSNILEIEYNNSEFMRVFAFKLLEHKRAKMSIKFFREVGELRPFEAQSFRDLALALEGIGHYSKAVRLHYKILTSRWDRRFAGTKIITANEMNHVINKHHVKAKYIDKRLLYRLKVDMRIVINWSTNNTDMDLWVIDPYIEKTYYGHKVSYIGGKISNDMTQGYGPEEFMIREAVDGAYEIKVKYFASHQQKLTGPTVIRAEVYTHYGTKKEKKEEILFRVEDEKEIIDLGKVSYR